MSIESNIEALTAAVNKLTAALEAQTAAVQDMPVATQPDGTRILHGTDHEGHHATVIEKVAKPGKSSPTAEVKAEKPAAEPETASSPSGVTHPSTGETAAPEAAQTTDAEPIPFKTLADAAIRLNNKDYNKLAAICKDEKVAKISGLAPERYADVLARINKELAE